MPAITLDNATMHYTERGAGEKSLVLVHGFPVDGRMWDRVLPDPPPGWRVITPDLPGFGRSSSSGKFTMDSLAEDLHQFMHRVNAIPAVVAGFSMGGYVALAYAKKCPRELRGLILVDTKAEGDTAEGKEKRNKMIATVREKGSKAIADAMIPNFVTKQHQDDQRIMSIVRPMMEACPATTIENALAAMRDRADMTDFLPSVSDRTLIIVGEEDAITPKSVAEAMHKAVPRSKLEVIPKAGHAAPIESPEAVTRAVADFVATLA